MQRAICCWIITPAQPAYPAASVRDYCSGAYTVRPAHLANERAQLSRDLRSANMVARSPVPIRSKPSTVPANDRFRPDNRNGVNDGGEPVIKPNKQKTIGIVE